MDPGVYTAAVALFILWVLFPIAFPVSGIWKRDGEEEYIEIEQFGPFVSGKRSVDGGNHLYSGFQHFIFLWLRRRDFGIPAFMAQGFPEAVAKKLNGSVTARLHVRRASRAVLTGNFRPQRILFDAQTARVMSRHYEPKAPRRFTLTHLTELPTGKVEILRTGLPPPDVHKKKKRRTF